MINVSSYWTLPPAHQRMTRIEVAHFERDLQRVVGHYYIEREIAGTIEFILFCEKCYPVRSWHLIEEYTSITKEEYLDKNHDMHGEVCQMCNGTLA